MISKVKHVGGQIWCLCVTSCCVIQKNIAFFKLLYHIMIFICLIAYYLVFSFYDTRNTVKLKSQSVEILMCGVQVIFIYLYL